MIVLKLLSSYILIIKYSVPSVVKSLRNLIGKLALPSLHFPDIPGIFISTAEITNVPLMSESMKSRLFNDGVPD